MMKPASTALSILSSLHQAEKVEQAIAEASAYALVSIAQTMNAQQELQTKRFSILIGILTGLGIGAIGGLIWR
jgi:hypothetical protein